MGPDQRTSLTNTYPHPPERRFLEFLKEDLFCFFSIIIFSEIFAFAIYTLIMYAIRLGPMQLCLAILLVSLGVLFYMLSFYQHLVAGHSKFRLKYFFNVFCKKATKKEIRKNKAKKCVFWACSHPL